MKKIEAALAVLAAACAMFFSQVRADCSDDCCGGCLKKFNQCRKAYEQRLYSECHSSCGSLYPRSTAEYNACLDECYDDAAAEIESGGDGICTGRYDECKSGCGGCPDLE